MTTPKEEIIEIEINKTIFKKAIKAHKEFAQQGKNIEDSPLAWIKFIINDENLELLSSNGSQALISKIEIHHNYKTQGEFCLSAKLVSKLSFTKTKLDEIKIYSDGTTVEFIDTENSSIQSLPKKFGSFPNIKAAFPKTKQTDFVVYEHAIKDLTKLKSESGVISFAHIPQENKIILNTTESEQFHQQAIIMTLQNIEI